MQGKTATMGNGSVTAGECLGGVRPSSGAATTKHADVFDFITSPSLSNVVAPEDGRTLPSSLPPSLTGYKNGKNLLPPQLLSKWITPVGGLLQPAVRHALR